LNKKIKYFCLKTF